ncbi:MAG: hypothetical protein GY756_24365 [bacterium]|nr:hypothetical protein [bacterium]
MSLRYHYNLIYNDFDNLIKGFSWNSLQVKLAIKTALACTIAVAAANTLQLGFPFWAGISALVMMRSDVGASFAKGWMRSLGCTIGCILTLFFVGFCVQSPILFSLFIVVGSLLGFYLGFQAKYGYFWLYMLANMVLMGMVVLSNPYGDFPLHIVYYRAADIFIGVIASWLVNIILWPRYAGDDLIVSSKQLLSKTALLVKECLFQYTENKYNEKRFNNLYNDVLVLLKKNNSLVGSSKLEKKLFRNHRVEFETMFQILDYKIKHLRIIYNHSLKFKNSDYSKHYLKLLNLMILNFDDLSKKEFYDNRRKIKRLLIEIQLNFNKVKSLYSETSVYAKSYPLEEVMAFHEIIYFLESFYNDFTYVLRNSFQYKNKLPGYKKIDSDKTDYFLIKLFSYEVPIYIPVAIHATKATFGILFTFWFCLWLQIPGGLLNMSVAIIAVFASQTDIITSNHKGILRMSGCLIGGAVGMFILQFGIESSFAIFSIILCVTFLTSYLFTARPGIAYIGLQAGIAFLMCVAGDFSAVTSFAPVIERLTGIILAIICMWVVNFIIWPDNLLVNLKRKLSVLKVHVLERVRKNNLHDSDNIEYKKFIDISSIEAVVNNLKIQQDISAKDIKNIESWSIGVRRISNKLSLLEMVDKEVIKFLKIHNPKLFKHLYKSVELAVLIDSDKSRDKIQFILNKQNELIDEFLQEVRTKGLFKKEKIDFKAKCSHTLLSVKRIISDLKELSEININHIMLFD